MDTREAQELIAVLTNLVGLQEKLIESQQANLAIQRDSIETLKDTVARLRRRLALREVGPI